MGNVAKIILGLVLISFVVAAGVYRAKNKAVVSKETAVTTPSAPSAIGRENAPEEPSAKRPRKKKMTPAVPAIAAEIHPSTPPVEALTEAEILEELPSAQEEVGNDPTVLRSRFEISDEYFNNSGSPDFNLLTARVDGALTPKLALRLDLPFMFMDSNETQIEPNHGLADVMLRASAVLKKTPRTGFTGFCDFWFPTAETSNFGLGKYSAGPGIVATGMNPYKDMMISGALQHKFSYAGDASRTDISRTKVDVVVDTSFRDRYWFIIDPVIFMDWVGGQSACDLEFETGMRMGEHWSAWVRPGVGLWGQAVSGGYNSYLQAGVRYMFGEPVREKFLKELRRNQGSGLHTKGGL